MRWWQPACTDYRACAEACADCNCLLACQAGVDSTYVSTAELAVACEASARARTCAAACAGEVPGTQAPTGCARQDAAVGKDASPPSQAPTPGTYGGGGVKFEVNSEGTSVTLGLDYTKQCSTRVLAGCTSALSADHRFTCSNTDWIVSGYFDTTESAVVTIQWLFTDYCQGVLTHLSGAQTQEHLHLVSDPCAPGDIALSASATRIATGKVAVIEAAVTPVLATCSQGVANGTAVDWSLQGSNASGSSVVVAQSTTSAGKATGGVQAGDNPGWVTVRGGVVQTADLNQSATLSILVSRPCDPTTPTFTSTGMTVGKGASLPVTIHVAPFDAATCTAGVADGTSVTFTLVDPSHELTLSAASTTTSGGAATVTVVAPATTSLTSCYEVTLKVEVRGPAGDVYSASKLLLYEPRGSCAWG